MSITAAQSRMARAALGWSTDTLAEKATVGRATVQRFEQGRETFASTVGAIRLALEAGGIVFLAAGETPDGGPGVRLKG